MYIEILFLFLQFQFVIDRWFIANYFMAAEGERNRSVLFQSYIMIFFISLCFCMNLYVFVN